MPGSLDRAVFDGSLSRCSCSRKVQTTQLVSKQLRPKSSMYSRIDCTCSPVGGNRFHHKTYLNKKHGKQQNICFQGTPKKQAERHGTSLVSRLSSLSRRQVDAEDLRSALGRARGKSVAELFAEAPVLELGPAALGGWEGVVGVEGVWGRDFLQGGEEVGKCWGLGFEVLGFWEGGR